MYPYFVHELNFYFDDALAEYGFVGMYAVGITIFPVFRFLETIINIVMSITKC